MSVHSAQTDIFLHIPKAGGNTFFEFMLPNYAAEEQRDLNLDLAYSRNFEELLQGNREQNASLRLVYGHQPYGAHEAFDHPCRYITVMRDPIDRVSSLYYFIQEQTTHPLHDDVIKMNLLDFLKSGITGEVQDGITRLLIGDANSDSLRGHGPLPEGALDIAMQRLSEFKVIGQLSSFDRTLHLCAAVMGWELRKVYRQNTTAKRVRVEQLSVSDREAIAEHNQRDLALFQFGQQRFEADCQKYKIPAEVERLTEKRSPTDQPSRRFSRSWFQRQWKHRIMSWFTDRV